MKLHVAFSVGLAMLVWGSLDLAYKAGVVTERLTGVVNAQVTEGISSGLEAYAFDTLSVTSGAAVALTAAKLNPANQPSAKAVAFTVETAAIRYRYDSATAPTTTVGHLRAATDIPYVVPNINNLNRFKMIAASTTTSVTVTYLR